MFSFRILNKYFYNFDFKTKIKADDLKKNIQNQAIHAFASAFFFTIIAAVLAGGGGCAVYAVGLNTLPIFIGNTLLAHSGFFALDVIGLAIRNVSKLCRELKKYACQEFEKNTSFEALWGDENDAYMLIAKPFIKLEFTQHPSALEEDYKKWNIESLISLFSRIKNENHSVEKKQILDLLAKVIVSNLLLSEQKVSVNDNVVNDLSEQIDGLYAIGEEVYNYTINNFIFLTNLFLEVNQLRYSYQQQTVLNRFAALIFAKLLTAEKWSVQDKLVETLAERICSMNMFLSRNFDEKNFNFSFLIQLFFKVERLKEYTRDTIKNVLDWLAVLIISKFLAIGRCENDEQYEIVKKLAPRLYNNNRLAKEVFYQSDGIELKLLVSIFLSIKQQDLDEQNNNQASYFSENHVLNVLAEVIFSKLFAGEEFNNINRSELAKALVDHMDVLKREKITTEVTDFDFLCETFSHFLDTKTIAEFEFICAALSRSLDNKNAIDEDGIAFIHHEEEKLETLVIAIASNLKTQENFSKIMNYFNLFDENETYKIFDIMIAYHPNLGLAMFNQYVMEWNKNFSDPEKQIKIECNLVSIMLCLQEHALDNFDLLFEKKSKALNATLLRLIDNLSRMSKDLNCLSPEATDGFKKFISYLFQNEYFLNVYTHSTSRIGILAVPKTNS